MSYNPDNPWQANQPSNPWGGQFRPKPPVIPFRPLKLGDLFDGTFAAIRSNPKVMFTISLGVMAIVGVLSGLATAMFPEENIEAITVGSNLDVALAAIDPSGTLATAGAQGIVAIITAGATLLVTGMLVLSVTNAVVGINLDLNATWNQLKPHFWRLVGTALLVWLIIVAAVVVLFIIPTVVLFAVVAASSGDASWAAVLFVLAIPVALAVSIWLGVRLYFATMVVVVEGASPTAALKRSWTLTKGAFWRTFGRLILMQIVVGIVVSLLSGAVAMIIMLLGGVLPWAITAFLMALTSSLVAGLAMPVSASYGSLMYVDERIRKENLGPALQVALDESRLAEA